MYHNYAKLLLQRLRCDGTGSESKRVRLMLARGLGFRRRPGGSLQLSHHRLPITPAARVEKTHDVRRKCTQNSTTRDATLVQVYVPRLAEGESSTSRLYLDIVP